MKKIISFISLLLCLCTFAPSCQIKPEVSDYDHAADFTKEDGEIYESVPTERYEDVTFRILNGTVGSSASHMDAETLDGNNLTQAIFQRNINVEERLGITVEEVRDTPEKVFDIAVKACLSGENTYSAICNSSNHMATMAVCGYLVMDTSLPGVDLTKPWWNEAAIDSAAVDSARFFFFGDLQLSFYDAHSMVGVNMDMINSLDGVDDPYSLVDSGKWTFDAMLRLMDAADADVDGNGKRNSEDRYGAALDKSAVLPLVVGCNSFVSSRDEYGLPYMSCMTDEKFYDVFKMVSDSLYNRCDYVYDTVKNEEEGASPAKMFKGGNSLFYIASVGDLANLRSMNSEFGILPMPKYSESQKNYVSLLKAENASAVGVLATGKNLLRTGNILENLAAESHRKGGLVDKYVDTVLSFKYVNDEKSRQNLRTIIAGGTFECADIYGWGGVCQKLTDLAGDSDTYSSALASVRLKALSDISDTVEEVNKHRT